MVTIQVNGKTINTSGGNQIISFNPNTNIIPINNGMFNQQSQFMRPRQVIDNVISKLQQSQQLSMEKARLDQEIMNDLQGLQQGLNRGGRMHPPPHRYMPIQPMNQQPMYHHMNHVPMQPTDDGPIVINITSDDSNDIEEDNDNFQFGDNTTFNNSDFQTITLNFS
jgi:hypothetical protein